MQYYKNLSEDVRNRAQNNTLLYRISILWPISPFNFVKISHCVFSKNNNSQLSWPASMKFHLNTHLKIN